MEGNTYKVYHDPVTKLDHEGDAVVVEELDRQEGHLIHCLVEFNNEAHQYYRWVDPRDKITG